MTMRPPVIATALIFIFPTAAGLRIATPHGFESHHARFPAVADAPDNAMVFDNASVAENSQAMELFAGTDWELASHGATFAESAACLTFGRYT